MAVFVSSALLPGLKFQLKQFEHHPHRRSGSFFLHRPNHQTLRHGCMNGQMTQFGEPNRVHDQLSGAKERLWNTIQEHVKLFPWDKAADKMQKRLLSSGHKALKWSLVALLAVTSLSDAVYSISRNQELFIPLGLFVGCLLADLLKEVSEEALRSIKKGSNWQLELVAIACVFLFFKSISLNFALALRVFLLHVGNGGLMQVLWLWTSLVKVSGTDGNETSSAVGEQN